MIFWHDGVLQSSWSRYLFPHWEGDMLHLWILLKRSGIDYRVHWKQGNQSTPLLWISASSTKTQVLGSAPAGMKIYQYRLHLIYWGDLCWHTARGRRGIIRCESVTFNLWRLGERSRHSDGGRVRCWLRVSAPWRCVRVSWDVIWSRRTCRSWGCRSRRPCAFFRYP